MRIRPMLIQWSTLFTGCAYFAYTATTKTKDEAEKELNEKWGHTVSESKANNAGLQDFLTKQKNKDPELNAQFDKVLHGGRGKNNQTHTGKERPVISAGIDDDV
jgi:hypothetical protein